MSDEPTPPPPAEPDSKDWTWVLDRPCPECGLAAATVGAEDVPAAILDVAARFRVALGRPDATVRPSPSTWSTVEYARHVADVCAVMAERLQRILDSGGDGAEFANWDQDATAEEDQYWASDPGATADLLDERAQAAAAAFARPSAEQWGWTGTRSNGSRFTASSLGQYFVHDIVHHVWDVRA